MSMRPPSSPDASTSAIRGASSAGWSPQRSPARRMMASAEERSPIELGSEQGSPSRIALPEHRANLGALRSHGLVSNSIFKGGASASPSAGSNASSPTSSRLRSPTSPQRVGLERTKLGVGLGISASTDDKAGRTTSDTPFARSHSGSSLDSRDSDEENEQGAGTSHYERGSPRKSTNFRRLEENNYVSNSPFRRTGRSPKDFTAEANDVPFELPNNAWSKTAAIVSQRNDLRETQEIEGDETPTSPATSHEQRVDNRPRTPPAAVRRQGDEVDAGTPTSARTVRVTSAMGDSPTRAGLLVSNRLLGPRQMDGGSATNSPHETPSKRERRKTVTFDEILDVQEFDRESSFEHESLKSGSSDASSIHNSATGNFDNNDNDGAMWLRNDDLSAQKVVERLMVINASPKSQTSSSNSTPDLAVEQHPARHLEDRSPEFGVDSSSNDSRDLSSVDEPQSPRNENESGLRHDDPRFLDTDVADVSGGNLSAYGALHRVESMVDELLGDEMLEGHQAKQARPDTSPLPSQQIDRSFDSPPRRRRPGASASAVKKTQKDETESNGEVKLSLPAWSPLMNVQTNPSFPHASFSPTERNTAAHPQSRSNNGRPHISRDDVLQRVAREKKIQEELTKTKNCESSAEQTPTAKNSYQAASSEQHRSPLDRLSVEVACTSKTEKDESCVPAASRDAVLSEKSRLDDRSRTWFAGSSRETSLEPEEQPIVDARSPPGSTPKKIVGITPAQQADQIIARRRSKNGQAPPAHRTRTRRSLSEADASAEEQEILCDNTNAERRQSCLLDANIAVGGNEFESGLQRELSRIYRQGDQKYRVKDRGVFASADLNVEQNIASGNGKGRSLDAEATVAVGQQEGKAWRKLRRPSDMNEYAKEMREYRAKENPTRMTGKVFVLVDSFTPSAMPVPARPTRFYCILDNGLHVVRTATSGLRASGASKIGQEFELIQQKDLTFSLTLVVQRDSHLQEPAAAPVGSPSGKRDRISPSFSRGVGKLFSSPKKRNHPSSNSLASSVHHPSETVNGQHPQQEPMLAFLNREGAFGQAKVVFERVAKDCLVNCLVIDLPVLGVHDPPNVSLPTAMAGSSDGSARPSSLPRTASLANDFASNFSKVRGTLRLKMFYLPPLPGVAKALLPDNLSQCIKGMEAARWYVDQPCIEGTLTQLGGDCQSWRRRPVKVQGAHLIGFNEITKKATVKIDLAKAISVEENKDPVKHNVNEDEELDETYHVERSFRITFRDGERIFYFADTDKEMHMWLNALRRLIGNGRTSEQCAWAQVALDMLKSNGEKQVPSTHKRG